MKLKLPGPLVCSCFTVIKEWLYRVVERAVINVKVMGLIPRECMN